MKHAFKIACAAFSLVFTAACKPKSTQGQAAAVSGNQSMALLDPKTEALKELGEFLTRIANTQYDLVDSNSLFSIDGKAITIAVDGCPKSYFQLKKYEPGQHSDSDAALKAEDFAAWNSQADRLNAEVIETLKTALENSNCSFKDSLQIGQVFPEFAAFDEYWSKAYDKNGFLTDEEYEELAKAQPALIDQNEFVRRMSCIKGFSIKAVTLSPKVCMITRFESGPSKL